MAAVLSNRSAGDEKLDAFSADLEKLAEQETAGIDKQALLGEVWPTMVGSYLTALPALGGAPALAAYHLSKGDNPHEAAIKRIRAKLEEERAPEMSVRMVPVDEKGAPIPPSKTNLYEPVGKSASADPARSRADELAEKFLRDTGLVPAG